MNVSAADRRALARQQRGLESAEELGEVTGEARKRAIAEANAWRREHGIADLRDDADRPELELHELARSRGLVSPVR